MADALLTIQELNRRLTGSPRRLFLIQLLQEFLQRHNFEEGIKRIASIHVHRRPVNLLAVARTAILDNIGPEVIRQSIQGGAQHAPVGVDARKDDGIHIGQAQGLINIRLEERAESALVATDIFVGMRQPMV